MGSSMRSVLNRTQEYIVPKIRLDSSSGRKKHRRKIMHKLNNEILPELESHSKDILQKPSILLKEIPEAIRKMNKDGAPGDNLITIRMLHNGGDLLHTALQTLYSIWWDTGHTPVSRQNATIRPLYKD